VSDVSDVPRLVRQPAHDRECTGTVQPDEADRGGRETISA